MEIGAIMDKLEPIGTNIIVKKIETTQEVKSGELILEVKKTSSIDEIASKATVIASNDESIKVSDIIYYETHGGHDVNINGEEYTILGIKNVLAKIV